MALVKQVRVIRNVVWAGAMGLLALGLVWPHLWEHREALGLGGGAGGLCGYHTQGRAVQDLCAYGGASRDQPQRRVRCGTTVI